MWYEREIGFRNQPYRRFTADVVWSLVITALVGTVVFGAGLPMWAALTASATVAPGLAWLIHRRVVVERTRQINTANPRMRALMVRYGAVPRAAQGT